MVKDSPDNPQSGKNNLPGKQFYRWWMVTLVLCLFGLAAFPFDVAVTKTWHAGEYPSFIREVVENTEPFGHAVGVVFILIAIYVLDVSRRFAIPRIAMATFGAGLLTNILKLIIGRSRPRTCDIPELTSFTETFTGLFPLWNGITKSQSFPSAHTTVAVAFAVMLAHFYPRGRWMFFALATCVAIGRTQCLAHFPSDVFFGAALGWSFAHVTITIPVISRILEFRKTTNANPQRNSFETETPGNIQTAG